MLCWHCNSELNLGHLVNETHKFFHCRKCDAWYEMYKEKERLNGAVPVRFIELDAIPQFDVNAAPLAA